MYKRKIKKYAFFGVQALYIKGILPTDKILVVECDKHISLFNLEDFRCEKYPHSIHHPEDSSTFCEVDA